MNENLTTARDEIALEAALETAASIPSITRRYYLVWWFCMFSPSFIFAIYPLFLRSRGLNQFQINCVAAVYFVVTFLTDVPTGAFADAIGRRISVVIGAVLHAAAFLLYFVSFHYWHFIVAEIVDGVATTFGNGAIDAWAVDALDEAGFVGAKDRLFSRAGQVWRTAAMIGALAGAYVARTDIAFPFLMGTIAWLAFGIAAMLLMDGHKRSKARIDWSTIARDIRDRMVIGTKVGFNTRTVLLMATAAMLSSAAWTPYWNEWQHYFNSRLGTGIEVVGWLFCLFTIAQMAGAEIVARFEWAWRRRAQFMIIGVAGSSIAYVLAGTAGSAPLIALVAFVISNIWGGASNPVYMSWFNEQIEGDNRATLLSFQSTFQTFGASAGLPVQGRLADRFGVGIAWQAAGALAMLQLPCFIALRERRAEN